MTSQLTYNRLQGNNVICLSYDVCTSMECRMKIKNKPIEAVRIRKDRAESLKNKALQLTIETGEFVTEADLVNFLIDKQLDKIKAENKTLKLEDEI